MENLEPKPGDLEPIETASRDEIQALQLRRMKWSLGHAYANSPFYRQKFDAAGVHPDDLETLGDLARFPLTVKADLRGSYPFGMFAVPRARGVRSSRRRMGGGGRLNRSGGGPVARLAKPPVRRGRDRPRSFPRRYAEIPAFQPRTRS